MEGGVPLPGRLGSLGASRALPAEPQTQTILGRFVCNFVRFHASFSAFNSCLETGDFYIPLPPTLIFGVSGHPRHPQWRRHCPSPNKVYLFLIFIKGGACLGSLIP